MNKLNQQSRRAALIIATVGVWSVAIGLSVGRFKLSAKANVTVALATKPASVRVTIDGDKYADGAYVDSPLQILLPPGRHKLKISRDGFIAHLVTVEGDAGEAFHMDDVVLQRHPDAIFGTVEVAVTPSDTQVHIDIDDGLVRAEAPFTTPDLTANTQHTMKIFPKWPDKEPHVKCRFTAPAPTPTTDEAPYRIDLKVTNGKVRAQGCERVRDSKKKQ